MIAGKHMDHDAYGKENDVHITLVPLGVRIELRRGGSNPIIPADTFDLGYYPAR
jgi:hypothetical protein